MSNLKINFLFFPLLWFFSFFMLLRSWQNSLRRNRLLEQPLPQASHFLIHPAFSQGSQLSYLWYPTSRCAGSVWLTGQHAAAFVFRYFQHQPLPKEAKNFPGGGKYLKHVPLPTYIAYLKPIQSIIIDWYLNISKLRILLKIFQNNIFYLLLKETQSILLINKYTENLLLECYLYEKLGRYLLEKILF